MGVYGIHNIAFYCFIDETCFSRPGTWKLFIGNGVPDFLRRSGDRKDSKSIYFCHAKRRVLPITVKLEAKLSHSGWNNHRLGFFYRLNAHYLQIPNRLMLRAAGYDTKHCIYLHLAIVSAIISVIRMIRDHIRLTSHPF
jgi:hypothetical protein